MVATAIAAVYVVYLAFKVIGVIIFLVGILNLFGGTYFVSGVLKDVGLEYFSTNLGSNIITAIVCCLIGAGLFFLQDVVDLPDSIGALILLVIALIIGFKMMHENNGEGFDFSEKTHLLGKITPILYLSGAALYFVLSSLRVSPIFSVILVVGGAVAHVFRLIGVCSEYDF